MELSPTAVRPARPARRAHAGGECCRALCPCGNPCTCSGHPHALHICSDPDCPCHSRTRYDEARQRK